MIMQQMGDRPMVHERLGPLSRAAQAYEDARRLVEPMVRDPEILTVYVSIGNSDDKLVQAQWSTFCQVVDNVVRGFCERVHGVWYSLPNAAWQNACWCFEIDQNRVQAAKFRLGKACADFGQDSIAWAVASTEFIRPVV